MSATAGNFRQRAERGNLTSGKTCWQICSSFCGLEVFHDDGHTRIGLAAGDHAVLIWPLLCGMAKAKLHLLTCRKIKGREAERTGLVSEAVPAAEVLPRAFEIAAELAALPPLGLEFTKRALNLWLRQALPAFEASLGYERLTSFNPQLPARVGQVAGGAAR